MARVFFPTEPVHGAQAQQVVAATLPAPVCAKPCQPRVHAYEPERARPLLLIACSDKKLEGTHRAVDLYRGVMYDVLRKWMPQRNLPDIYIISAKHGLVHADTFLQHYDELMTEERQQALIDRGIDVRDFGAKSFSEVFIAGGALYREIGLSYAWRLLKAGFLAPDAPVQWVEGGIGEHRGQLGAYLRDLGSRGPLNPEQHTVDVERIEGVAACVMRAKNPSGFRLGDKALVRGWVGYEELTIQRWRHFGDRVEDHATLVAVAVDKNGKEQWLCPAGLLTEQDKDACVAQRTADARAYWKAGMAGLLAHVAEFDGLGPVRCVQAPVVIESIMGDDARVRAKVGHWNELDERVATVPLHVLLHPLETSVTAKNKRRTLQQIVAESAAGNPMHTQSEDGQAPCSGADGATALAPAAPTVSEVVEGFFGQREARRPVPAGALLDPIAAGLPDDVKTYTAREAQAQWDGAHQSKRRSFLLRVLQGGNDTLLAAAWADMTPEDRQLAHAGMNGDFYSPVWYITKGGVRLARPGADPGPVKDPEEQAAEQAAAAAAQTWAELTPRKRHWFLVPHIGAGADGGQYAEWNVLAPELQRKLIAEFSAERVAQATVAETAPAKPARRPRKAAARAGDQLPNGTAPEHVGSDDDRELAELVETFNAAQASMMTGSHPVSNVFQPPAKGDVVRLANKVKVYHRDHGWLTPDEAKALIAQWRAHAEAQGDDAATCRANSQRVVLSLFDKSGAWSEPWETAGYSVFRFDIQTDPEMGDVNNFSTEFFGDWFGDFDGMDIYAVLAATPCTDFANSGARHFAAKDSDGRTFASVQLVHQTLRVIEYFKPVVWAIENPVGRIQKLGGLPQWRLSFNPNHLGHTYTKKTLLWGRFNGDLPIAPVEPTEGSKMHKKYGGKSMATKNARSETPEGFALAFFMANNAADHPAMAIVGKYDRLDAKLIERALAAGVTGDEISSAVDDFYYMDLDDDAANNAIRDLIPEHGGESAAVASETAAPARRRQARAASTEQQLAPQQPKRKARKPTPKQVAAEELRKEQVAYWAERRAEAREYWAAGMVTSLPVTSEIEGLGNRYSYCVPGIVETITGDVANVRIYAAPQYGYTLENDQLHGRLALGVPLTELGKYALNQRLQKIVDEGKLATGDADVAAEIRARNAELALPVKRAPKARKAAAPAAPAAAARPVPAQPAIKNSTPSQPEQLDLFAIVQAVRVARDHQAEQTAAPRRGRKLTDEERRAARRAERIAAGTLDPVTGKRKTTVKHAGGPTKQGEARTRIAEDQRRQPAPEQYGLPALEILQALSRLAHGVMNTPKLCAELVTMIAATPADTEVVRGTALHSRLVELERRVQDATVDVVGDLNNLAMTPAQVGEHMVDMMSWANGLPNRARQGDIVDLPRRWFQRSNNPTKYRIAGLEPGGLLEMEPGTETTYGALAKDVQNAISRRLGAIIDPEAPLRVSSHGDRVRMTFLADGRHPYVTLSHTYRDGDGNWLQGGVVAYIAPNAHHCKPLPETPLYENQDAARNAARVYHWTGKFPEDGMVARCMAPGLALAA